MAVNQYYPPTPTHMKFDDIPLTSGDSVSKQLDRPVKVHSSCRFPPE